MFIFLEVDFDDEVKEKFSHLKEGEVILVENIRYFKEETEDDENFSKKLAHLEIFILMMLFHAHIENNHLLHNITKFIKKSFAGPLLKKEIEQ